MRLAGKAVIPLLIMAAAMGCSKDKLAEVNGHVITAGEFLERYQKYLDETSERDNIVTRKKVLTNMVNEKLIYDDVHRQGFDADRVYSAKIQDMTDQALLDAYAKSVSSDTITVSEQELEKEFRALNSKVTARFLYGKTKDEALRLRDSLEHGATFEALAKTVFDDPGLANSGGSLGTFGWGEMDPELEEVAFNIPVDSISQPIELRMGYSIVKVERRVRVPLASEYDFAKAKPKLDRAIRQRKITKLQKQAADAVSEELSPKFDAKAVDTVLSHWPLLLDEAQTQKISETGPPLSKGVSAMTLMSLRNGEKWTIGEFLQKVERTLPAHRRRVKSTFDVEEIATGLATRDVLLARAKEAGMDRDPDVLAQVQKARDGWLLKRWAKSVQDTVGRSGWNEDSLKAVYEQNRKEYVDPPMVNVAEILSRTQPEAENVLKMIRRGMNFADLARKYSIRTWARERGGELGFNTRASFGALGEKFFKARIGEVIGPEFVDPYYGVFKILAKKGERERTYNESRDDIIASLLPMRKRLAFAGAVGHLRQNAQTVDMDVVALSKIAIDHK